MNIIADTFHETAFINTAGTFHINAINKWVESLEENKKLYGRLLQLRYIPFMSGLIMYFKRKDTKNKNLLSKQPPGEMYKAKGDYYVELFKGRLT